MVANGESTVSIRRSTPRSVTTLSLDLLRRDVWFQVIIASFVLAYCVSTVTVSRTNSFNTFWDGGVYTVAELLPVVAMILCAKRWPAQRVPWLLIAAGVMVHAAGDLVYSFHDQNLVPTPVPALSDIVFLASYVLLVVGVVFLTQSHVGRVRASVRIEGFVAGLMVASLAALFWFGPALSITGSWWKVIVADAYPVGNLVLLVLLISSLAPNGYRPNVPVSLLLAAVAWFVFGDIVYFGQATTGNYVSRTFLNVTWVIGLWLAELAATAVDRRRSGALQRNQPGERRTSWAPVASAFAFLAVVANYLIVPGVDTAAFVLACLGFVLLGVYLVFTKRELQDAATEGEEVDVVTGLITSVPFLAQVERWLIDESDGVVVLVILDILNFAAVNSAIGYAIADELLWAIGRRAQYRLGDRGVFARLGGDNFVFSAVVSSEQHVDEIADSVLQLATDRFRLSGFSVGVAGRVAVATTTFGATSATNLLARAQAALADPHPPVGMV